VLPLPLDPYVPGILERVREHRAVVVTGAPGSGKTTRLPPALAADGPVLVLQPRRIAARSIARRIADEQGWTIGREVGWQVRFERQFGADTRVLVATEGILTARAQADPLFSAFATIVLDEFHERSIHADLGIALARQAWLARGDLRVVVMSATMDAGQVAGYLDGCPIVAVPGAAHPVAIRYLPSSGVGEAVHTALGESAGQVLCFLAGAAEIRRAAAEVARALSGAAVDVVPLYGSLDAVAQDDAIAEHAGRRVILATNIAETSLTVPGVRAVVDTGLHKVARYDPDRAIDSLDVERISLDAADQRAGRAGRLGPGLVLRLWHQADRLRPHREADVHRVDISAALLDIVAWGGDPRAFEWFDPPAPDTIASGLELLERLGALSGGRLTETGRRMSALPLHPRLARIMIEAGGAREAAIVCALLSERHQAPGPPADVGSTTTNDLLRAVDHEAALPPHVRRVAASVQAAFGGPPARISESELRRAMLRGYPDRVGKRRVPGSDHVLLASGHGAVIARESGVREAELLLALDVTAGRRGASSEATIRIASAVEREWLSPTGTEVIHELHEPSGSVRATERQLYGAIVLRERPAPLDAGEARAILARACLAHPHEADLRLLRRLQFAELTIDLPSIVEAAAAGARALHEIHLADHLPWEVRQALARLAPETIAVPSGRNVRLDYQEGGTVVAGVKLQELFGLAETPRIGPHHTPLVMELRAPNGRPVQLTTDLRSFWERTYPDVRRELRGRYPRHPWPEDPWRAAPTARTVRRT
jgi:ATP-dependent helicase HrpB